MTFDRRRPLIRTAPNGRPYIAARDLPTSPRYTPGPRPAQPASGPATAPEPTPKATADRCPKLTDDDVRAIRAEYAAGRWTQTDLAYIYGVNQSTVQAVVRGRTHKHVQPQPDKQES